MKILINAYTCEPGRGSEPGMAWNWCIHLAKYVELIIITEGEAREKIEEAVAQLPQGKNMTFVYNPLPQSVRDMCAHQGDWRFYKYYKEWQWKTYLIAKDICTKEKIDVLHQLNMIGFREPGYLWKLSQETDIPLVWGPVDAKDKFPMAYTKGASIKTKAFLWLKNTITCWQLGHSTRVREMAKTAKVIFSASSNSVRSFKKYMNIKSPLLNETGCSAEKIHVTKPENKQTFDILWVGKMDFRKQLSLALKSVASTYTSNIRFHIVGGGDSSAYKNEAETLNINDSCVWHGTITHDEVQQLMQHSNLFLFTSVAEGTPHVVLEAIANHLPVLCFDTCGQGDSVDENVGVRIPLTTPTQSVKDFAEAIRNLYKNKETLKQMSEACKQRQQELSWDRKAKRVVDAYKTIQDR